MKEGDCVNEVIMGELANLVMGKEQREEKCATSVTREGDAVVTVVVEDKEVT